MTAATRITGLLEESVDILVSWSEQEECSWGSVTRSAAEGVRRAVSSAKAPPSPGRLFSLLEQQCKAVGLSVHQAVGGKRWDHAEVLGRWLSEASAYLRRTHG